MVGDCGMESMKRKEWRFHGGHGLLTKKEVVKIQVERKRKWL